MTNRVVRNLLFLDSETTGLDCQHHEMIEVGAILTTPDGRKVLGSFEAKVKPEYIERAHPKALEVNGYNAEEWQGCPDEALVATTLLGLTKNVILVGQNISFDEGFLSAFLRKHELKANWHYHKVDTMALAWPLYATQRLNSLSLKDICEFLGLPAEASVHRAMQGAQKARDVYLALMERYEGIIAAQSH